MIIYSQKVSDLLKERKFTPEHVSKLFTIGAKITYQCDNTQGYFMGFRRYPTRSNMDKEINALCTECEIYERGCVFTSPSHRRDNRINVYYTLLNEQEIISIVNNLIFW